MQALSFESIGRYIMGQPIRFEGGISSVSIDSRTVLPGGLFVALEGENADGHDYVNAAFERGAAAALCQREIKDAQGRIIYVADTVKALGDIARGYLADHRPQTVMGITGSVGKTSTKDFMASVLSTRCKTLKTKGNYNNHIGLPLSVFELEDHEAAVFEMGMSGFGEISYLTSIVKPDIAVITNIGVSHAENLGSREGILKAKSEIFEGLAPGGFALLNADDGYLPKLAGTTGAGEIFFGIDSPLAKIRAEITSEEGGYVAFSCSVNGQTIELEAFGRHNIYNMLPAVAVGGLLKIPAEDIKRGIEACESADMRLQIFTSHGIVFIKDCYNASPDSMRAAFDILAKMDAGSCRKLAVLGGMRELGAYSDEEHRKIGALACSVCDRLLAVGESSELYLEGAASPKAAAFEGHEAAAKELADCLAPGDIVLFKASRAARLERVIDLVLEERK